LISMPNTDITNAKKIRCPQCSGPSLFHPSNAYRPFCSERCKMIDLGAWANDEYAVPGSPLESPLVASLSPDNAVQEGNPQTLQ